MDYQSFESIWRQFEDFEFSINSDDHCIFAQEFEKCLEDLLDVIEDPDIISINQAKIQLQDKYFEWRSIVPKSHKNRVSQVGHKCIFHVYERAYYLLRIAEISLSPPLLVEPPPSPPPPPPPQIAGLFLGELDE